MHIKKSALILIMLFVSSVSLVVISSGITPPAAVIPVIPSKCTQVNRCTQNEDTKPVPSWDMISHLMLRSAA